MATRGRVVALLTATAVAGGAVGAALLFGQSPTVPTATAAPTAVSVDVAAAEQAATTDEAAQAASRFFVHLDQRAANEPVTVAQKDIDAAAKAKAAKAVGEPVPIYSLNPDFVTSGNPATPVARLAYLAVETRSATGQRATIQLVKSATGYELRGIADGVEELTYNQQGGGAPVFVEPQQHAYYKLVDGRILPLNDSATAVVGTAGLALAEYQKVVHDRYADKMPGSDYVRDHKLG